MFVEIKKIDFFLFFRFWHTYPSVAETEFRHVLCFLGYEPRVINVYKGGIKLEFFLNNTK